MPPTPTPTDPTMAKPCIHDYLCFSGPDEMISAIVTPDAYVPRPGLVLTTVPLRMHPRSLSTVLARPDGTALSAGTTHFAGGAPDATDSVAAAVLLVGFGSLAPALSAIETLLV